MTVSAGETGAGRRRIAPSPRGEPGSVPDREPHVTTDTHCNAATPRGGNRVGSARPPHGGEAPHLPPPACRRTPERRRSPLPPPLVFFPIPPSAERRAPRASYRRQRGTSESQCSHPHPPGPPIPSPSTSITIPPMDTVVPQDFLARDFPP